jgi:ATP-binding cassette subfamily B protein
LGEFVAFNGYLAMLTWPLMAVGHVVNQYQRGTAALSRILEILDTPLAPGYLTEGSNSVDSISGEIEFRNLRFAYQENRSVINGLSLRIPAGATCGIIGETGSGKSTLVNLLARLYEPAEGTVFIDGVDIRRIALPVLRRSIGFVAQDIFLFSGTLRDNILFGLSNGGDLHDEGLEEAARIAQLLPAIQEFTSRFDTVLGERGVRLSGGQKQRTALARAIIKDPRILILDDAFSSVDTETEDAILNALAGFMRKRTTLLISHRVSTVQRADLIVYVTEGRILEQGTHQELLDRGGAYRRLYLRQRLVRELDEMQRGEERG